MYVTFSGLRVHRQVVISGGMVAGVLPNLMLELQTPGPATGASRARSVPGSVPESVPENGGV